MTKKIVVTGGAGFIGSHIVDHLIEQDQQVIVLDNFSTGKKENKNPKATYIYCDLSSIDQKELNSYTKDCSVVFHCAALPNVQYSIDYPYESNKANVDITIKILESIRYNNIQKIIYSSSSSVYGNAQQIPTKETESIKPLSPYALQKYIGEQYCLLYHQLYNIQCIILRYFNVYGDRMTDKGSYVSVLSHFFKAIKNNQPLNIVNDGEQTRDFINVNDVVQANIAAMNNNISFETLNIGYGNYYSINEIAELFNTSRQYKESRIEPQHTLADISKAKELLSWQPKIDLKTWIGEKLDAIHK